MKKFISICLFIVLIASMITGCSKADKGKDQEAIVKEAEQKKDEKKEETIDYVLYLRHKDKPFLFDEAYSIKVNDDKLKGISMEEFVVKELIGFKGLGEYINPIPKGTKLLSIKKESDTVIVNLSKEFVEGQKGTSNDTLLSLATIVNSITILPDNKKVQFMIEGEILDKMNDIDVSKPFEYMDGLYPDK